MNNRTARWSLSAWTVAVIGLFTSMAQAAEQPVKFIVADSQIQTLGIQTAPLSAQTSLVIANFPAEVRVPPQAEQQVSAPVAGLVAQLLVQQNQLVRAGDPLLRLVSPQLGQLQLELLQASARATLARQAAQREQALFDEGIIPQRRVQEAQAGLKEAEATLHQAKAALHLSGMSAATIEQIAASGKPQESITLTATQAGVVTGIAVKPGQQVEPATALLQLMQTDTLWLDIQVPVTESAHWQPGTALKIAGKEVVARLLSVGTTVSTDSQTLMLRAVIEGKTDRLHPGEWVTVELPVAVVQEGWNVPLSAVAHDGNQAYLFVRTSDGFEARPVRVSASAAQQVRVQGSLKAGDEIAVSGVVALKGAWLDAKGGE